MKVLLVAGAEKHESLAGQLSGDFELTGVPDAGKALAFLAQQDVDAVVIHLDIGEEQALDVICGVKKRPPDRAPGIVVIGRELDLRAAIEVVRTGAYDFLLEGSLKPRELPHALRNAAYNAKSAAWLSAKRAARSKEVLVVGAGDAAEAVVLLLEASGFAVQHARQVPQAGEAKNPPRAIVVDLAAVGDGEALLKLLTAG